jgi:DNA-binding MarR family transcriptional regulator
MQRKQSRELLIDSADISGVVDQLEKELKANDAILVNTQDAYDLSEAHQALVLIIRAATERAKNEHLRLHNQLSSSFGTQEIAPTAMGNIANAAQAYAVRRYDCNLELVWNDLQRVVQKDTNAYAALQESKAQLDFLIACCYLTTLYWIIWVAASGVWGHSVLLFGALALLGPLGSYFWYRAATEHYRSFVDVLTTTLDLFRFELLRALFLTLPADVIDERILWNSLHRLASFDGEMVNLRYQHSKTSN